MRAKVLSNRVHMIVANVSSWGLPAALVITVAATKNLGYQPDAPLCSIRPGGPIEGYACVSHATSSSSSSSSSSFLLFFFLFFLIFFVSYIPFRFFWYPIIGITFLVVPLLLFVVVRLVIVGGPKALLLQWRLLLMIVYSAATYSLLSGMTSV